MAFVQLLYKASQLKQIKNELETEKLDAIKIKEKVKRRFRFRHVGIRIKARLKRALKKITYCFCCQKFCFKLRHDGSCENFVLRSFLGFISGLVLTYIFFMFFVFQLNLKITTATVVCSFLGCVLMNGLAFSSKIRCVVLLTLPHFFSEKGRQALLAYALILVVSGPAKNTLNNLGILSESLACGQEQLKAAVRQIIDVIKKPFYALKDAIKKVVETVKKVIKKIKEILMKIKRIIMGIIRVIKAAFEFLAKIINICNKELGTPFERCSRVFDNAIADCNAKLGSMFSWMCSITYIVKAVCYIVKPFDLLCLIVDFISNSIIGVVVRKVKSFVRHIRTMFYVRIKFSHSFHFETQSSKSIMEISREIVQEIKDRSKTVSAVFNFLTSAAMLFFIFMVVRVTYYRYKFLTSNSFDNKFITNDFHDIDMRRVRLNKETVLPLSQRESKVYVKVSDRFLQVGGEREENPEEGNNETSRAPNMPSAYISGNGLFADLLRSIVKAFQPVGRQLEIDTVPCLPTPIPPDYDRYIRIVTLLILCWVLTTLEPYGLRLRNVIMSYYHPTRAKQRSIWLYNHILRSRSSFLKFARRQLRRKLFSSKDIEKVTFREFLTAKFKIFALCCDKPQTACLLCGTVFRESDHVKPIRCQTPECLGVYCESCFADLRNLCTVCLSPIEYGDLSDLSEEKDSSEDEPPKTEVRQKRNWCKKRDKKMVKKKLKRTMGDGILGNTKQSSRWSLSKICSRTDSLSDNDTLPMLSKEKTERKKSMLSICSKGKKLENKQSKDTLADGSKTSWFKFCNKPNRCTKSKFEPQLKDKKAAKNTSKQNRLKISDSSGEDESTGLLSDHEKFSQSTDSDYHTTTATTTDTNSSTDYSYSYQYDKDRPEIPHLPENLSRDVEKQATLDYASMDSFREDAPEDGFQPGYETLRRSRASVEKYLEEQTTLDYASLESFGEEAPEDGVQPEEETLRESKASVGTAISGIHFEEARQARRVDFVGIEKKEPRKKIKRKKKKMPRNQKPDPDSILCHCTDTEDEDGIPFLEETSLITIPKNAADTKLIGKMEFCTCKWSDNSSSSDFLSSSSEISSLEKPRDSYTIGSVSTRISRSTEEIELEPMKEKSGVEEKRIEIIPKKPGRLKMLIKRVIPKFKKIELKLRNCPDELLSFIWVIPKFK
ncbi:hypothetical protein JTB14_019337 [Gonioctena quinquepunctata]|nr:hypothetical protein JTB14_019337 [Gonioctena quinquepunctata]